MKNATESRNFLFLLVIVFVLGLVAPWLFPLIIGGLLIKYAWAYYKAQNSHDNDNDSESE